MTFSKIKGKQIDVNLTGSFTGSFTGSLFGTSSWAVSASWAPSQIINTGSLVTTSSFNAFTSSYNTGSFTGSFNGSLLGTASFVISSSFASTASIVLIPPTLQQVLDFNHDLVDGIFNAGTGAGDGNIAVNQIAIGENAGSSNTGANQNVFGNNAGVSNTGNNQNALGPEAGSSNTGDNQNAIGDRAGLENTGDNQNALGSNAGRENIGQNQNALGEAAGFQNQGINQNAFGTNAGTSNTGENQNVLGEAAGYENQGINQNALGYTAGLENTGDNQNAFGYEAGYRNTGTDQNAIGNNAGVSNTGNNQNALGLQAGFQNIGDNLNAIGRRAGFQNTGSNVNALGNDAGYQNEYNNVNLFGLNANARADGQTVLSKDGTIMARIDTSNLAASRLYRLPDNDGIIALTGDLASYVPYTGATQNVNLGNRSITASNFIGTASFALTSSFVTSSNVFGPFGSNSVVSASYALTASYLDNYVPPFPFTGSAIITGSLEVTGSTQITGDLSVSSSLVVGAISSSLSAKVQIDSTTQGFLPPRMTTSQKNGISGSVDGLMVYDTDVNCISVYDNGVWINQNDLLNLPFNIENAFVSLFNYLTIVTSIIFSSNAANSNNQCHWLPFQLNGSVEIDSFTIINNAANASSGANSITIYIFDNSNDGLPGIKIHQEQSTLGILDTASQVITFGNNISLDKGNYWIGLHIRGLNTAGVNPTFVGANGISIPSINVGTVTFTNNTNFKLITIGVSTDIGNNPTVTSAGSTTISYPLVYIKSILP